MKLQSQKTEEELLAILGGCLIQKACEILQRTRPSIQDLMVRRKLTPLGMIGNTWVLDRAEVEALARGRR